MDVFPSPEKPLVLVVDDELLVRRIIADALEPAGFRTELLPSGEETLAFCSRITPDLIILDLFMRGMDGLETCRALRRLPTGAHIPILMITSANDTASIHDAFEAGVTDFIAKPFQTELLIHRLRYMLRAGATMSRLIQSEERLILLKEAVESLPIGVTVADVTGRILYVNPAEAQIHGYTREELDRRESRNLAPQRLKKEIRPEDLKKFLPWRRESINQHKDGREFPVQLSSTPVRNGRGEYIGMVTACEDISERKKTEEKIRHLAYFDTLTGLPNRWTLRDRMAQALARAEREQQALAVLFLDLDRFKFINDTMGHDFGDKLLEAVARRLEDCMRRADTVARLGGDEFVVVLTGLAKETGVAVAARRIQETFSHPFELEGRTVFSAPSIGIALYPEDGLTLDDLLKNADAAMYHSKAFGGGGAYHFFSQEMNRKVIDKMNLENQLRQALDNEEFVLYYQPQIELASGRLAGVEALVRWQHPEHGLIMPAHFIGVLEETGLILRLGEWVLREASAQTRQWREGLFPDLETAVNISGRQLKQPGFVKLVESIIKETGVDPGALEFELTESVIISDLKNVTMILDQLKNLGIHLSIDDFGTGYSSLSNLKNFPLDRIKIDRSFVMEITRNKDDAAIVESIVRMAQTLNLGVVAEGVEEPEQVEFLRTLGCEFSQGYYFSHALPAENFAKLTTPFVLPSPPRLSCSA